MLDVGGVGLLTGVTNKAAVHLVGTRQFIMQMIE